MDPTRRRSHPRRGDRGLGSWLSMERSTGGGVVGRPMNIRAKGSSCRATGPSTGLLPQGTTTVYYSGIYCYVHGLFFVKKQGFKYPQLRTYCVGQYAKVFASSHTFTSSEIENHMCIDRFHYRSILFLFTDRFTPVTTNTRLLRLI